MPSARIEYLDALRGLAMLFVVMAHVVSYGLMTPYDGLIGVTEMLQIPLFFLVSGYFAYRPSASKTAAGLLATVGRKFMTLIVPTVIFMTVYVYTEGLSMTGALNSPFKYGYWFTPALFMYFLLYLPLTPLVRKGRRVFDIVLVIQAIVVSSAGLKLLNVAYYHPWIHTIGLGHLRNYIFFAAGILWHRHAPAVATLLRNKAFTAAILLIFTAGAILKFGLNLQPFTDNRDFLLTNILLTSLGLAITVDLFQKYTALSDGNPFARFLKLCGRHSLEIYFIHYFFLPHNLYSLQQFFEAHPWSWLEFAFAAILAAIISAACILIGRILRLSPFLSRLLFGK